MFPITHHYPPQQQQQQFPQGFSCSGVYNNSNVYINNHNPPYYGIIHPNGYYVYSPMQSYDYNYNNPSYSNYGYYFPYPIGYNWNYPIDQSQRQQRQYNNTNNNNYHRNRDHDDNNNNQLQQQNQVNPLPSLQPTDCDNNDTNRDYLNNNQIFNWLKEKSIHTTFMAYDCPPFAYVSAIALIYDKWIRYDYKRKLWKSYLKFGQEYNYWTEEVFQATQTMDNSTNTKFLEVKISQLDENIDNIIKDFHQCESILFNYREYDRNYRTTDMLLNIAGKITDTEILSFEQINDYQDELNDSIKDYIMDCTRHFRKSIETKIQLAKVHADHF
ncbi:unnamed protein product [Adineta ricciae]|uniref:Uncharacterized protein n=1 Tax=Adineta ricciae TaxID=249248 RepID=A0A816BL98_ADIRI|nr:unnamed protein product [Adineta ricciae]CAF1610800.1 unnamed protein product [Adineta ricciae]